MAVEAANARASGNHVWASDMTNTGVTYSGPNSLGTMLPIFPKLWRRLDNYSRDHDIADPNHLVEFKDYLRSLPEERVFIISEGKSTGFDDIIKVDGDTIKMTVLPEDLIVVSR